MSTPTLREIAERIARAETCGGAGRCHASGPLCEDCAELADAIEAFGRQVQQAERQRCAAIARKCVRAVIPTLREIAEQIIGGHREVEDSYYSCPEAENYHGDSEGCDCAREQRIVSVEGVLSQVRRAERARSEADMRCETCVHFLPWRREGAKTPLDSILGDCQHPKFMGHITAVPKTFGCRFYWRRIIQTAIEAEEQP